MDKQQTNILISKIRDGDRIAFKSLFKLQYKSLCYYANGYIDDYEASRDIVQEVFIKIWEKRDSLVQFTNFESYIYKTVKHKSLDLIKSNSVKNKYAKNVLYTTSKEYTQTDNLEVKELETLINTTIERLPKLSQEIFFLSRREKKKYKEISLYLGISPKTVEAHISLVLRELKKNIKNLL